LSHAAVYGCRDDDTSVARGGDDEDDPDVSLQSTAALATLPLHDGSSDGSSSEETPLSPTFRLLMRLSFRSRLVIWRFLCCTLCAARRFSAAALFRLKITSSERGALARTRWHSSTSNAKTEKSQPERKASEKINITTKTREKRREDNNSKIFMSPHWGASGAAATAAMSRSTS
jgi:hypothetical protein